VEKEPRPNLDFRFMAKRKLSDPIGGKDQFKSNFATTLFEDKFVSESLDQ
jgi:hypothetical protein